MSLSSFTFANDKAVLKKEIFKLAESFKGQVDPDRSRQDQLQVLVDKLLQGEPNTSMKDKAIKAVGTWNQVWGPYAFDGSNSVPRGQLVDKIYQYISPNGYYYNFAEYKVLGRTVRSFLRGVYDIKTDRIRVEFNEIGVLREDPDYKTAGEDIEQGKMKVFKIPGNFPPIGVKGYLIEAYADDEIRINYGVVGDDISEPAMFIMRKVK